MISTIFLVQTSNDVGVDVAFSLPHWDLVHRGALILIDLSKTTETSLVIVTHDRRVAAQTDQQFELHHGQLQSV